MGLFDGKMIGSVFFASINLFLLHRLQGAVKKRKEAESLLGVKFAYFEKFIAENGGRQAFQGKTTAEVNASFLVHICKKGGASVCQQLYSQQSPFVGRPTWFISHAWSYQFLDVIEAVGLTLRRKEGEEKYRDVIVWFDQFTLNHTGSTALDIPYETLHDTFMNSTKQIGKMILIFDQWDNPKHLTRAWCVFEAYAAVYTNSQLEVGMSASEHERFLNDIVADYMGELFYNMLAKIKSEASQAAVPQDKLLIHRCITEKVPGGFTGLDRAIFGKLEEWIVSLLESQIKASENLIVEANWKYALADMLFNSGRFEEAQPYIESCVTIRSRELGSEHIDTLHSITNLARLYDSQGNAAKAEPLYLNCLATSRQVLGDENPDTLVSMGNLALFYQSQSKHTLAEPLYLECLSTRKRILGDDHPSTLLTVHNLAGLYWSQSKYEEAEPLYKDCLNSRRAVLGKEHPDTLVTTNNLAGMYESQGKYDDAEPLFLDCLAIMRRVLGTEHPSTLTTIWNLAAMYRNQRKLEQAKTSYIECVAGFRRVLGESHPDTQSCDQMYQEVLEEIKKALEISPSE